MSRRHLESTAVRLMMAGVLGGLVGCMPAQAPVTVRIVNATDFTLDPNLYASAEALSAGALFVPANLVTTFAAVGIPTIAPRASQTVTLECDQAATLGVDQPVFTDPVGLAGGGRSGTRFVLDGGTVFQCGQTLVLVYSGTEAGFGVTYTLE